MSSIIERPWYGDKNARLIYLHILVSVPGGTIKTTLENIARETRLSKSQVRTALQKLKDAGDVNAQIKGKETEFNISEPVFRQKGKATQQKRTVYFPNDELLDLAFRAFVEMRKKIKKPMTDHAINLKLRKIQDMSKGNNELAIRILEQSIENNWLDIYPLKDTEKTKQQTIDWDSI